jgi:hypothetical protein
LKRSPDFDYERVTIPIAHNQRKETIHALYWSQRSLQAFIERYGNI